MYLNCFTVIGGTTILSLFYFSRAPIGSLTYITDKRTPVLYAGVCGIVTIGQIQYVFMAHSGGDGCFVFTVHSMWIRVALATSCRCGSSHQDWWRTLR